MEFTAEEIQQAWRRSVLPAIASRSIPLSVLFSRSWPLGLIGDLLVLEFPADASFHRTLAEEPRNTALLCEALYQITGERLSLAFLLADDTTHDQEVPDA